MPEEKSKREEVKAKMDKMLAKQPEAEPEQEEELDKDKPTVWSPFAKKIYADIKIYKDKLGDAPPTRPVAVKFHSEIDDKLEDGKEKESLIKYYNKQFRLPGVFTLPWNYFAESIYNPKEMSKGWIKVKDFTPPITDKDLNRSDTFLIFTGKEIQLGYLQYDHLEPESETPEWKEKGRDAYTIKNVTHLMALPKPPVSETNII